MLSIIVNKSTGRIRETSMRSESSPEAAVARESSKKVDIPVNIPDLKMSIKKDISPAERKKEDLELVRRYQNGDEAAFETLMKRYNRKVYAVALSMVKNPEDAMDISQETFIKVHRYIGKFQGASSFYTWLYRITVNLCIDHIRKRGKQAKVDFDERFVPDEESSGGGDLAPNVDAADPIRELGRREMAGKIQKAIDDLPPYHKAVIVMREIEGMSYSEMSKALRVSKGTVMSRLHHARKKLQVSLEHYLEGNLNIE